MNICWNRIRLALVALACVGLSGCDWVLLDSKGMVGLAQRDLILICIGLMLIVVIPAIVLTFVFAWRFRAGSTKAKYTPEWSHSTKVEIVVWGVPLLIIAGLVGLGAAQGLSVAVVYGVLSFVACLPGLGVLLLRRGLLTPVGRHQGGEQFSNVIRC